ncbi:hypothetical protein Tco_1506590 [Tanacetum coccineum]
MPSPDPNNTYIKPPLKNQILKFIKTLSYDEDHEIKMIATRLHQPWRDILSVLNRSLTGKDSSWDTVRLPILQILWGIVYSANLDFASLIWDEFECDYKFGMEVPDAMNNDAIKKKAGYTYYMAKKVESKKAKNFDEPEDQHVSPVKNGRGKGFMCYGDQVANVPNKLKKDVVPWKTRYLTIAEERVVGELARSISIQEPRSKRRRRSQLTIDSQTNEAIADMYNEWGQKLKGPVVEDPAVQSLLDLQKGSKASRLKSLSANETDDANKSDMDLSDDNPHGDDAAARYGVFMHNKSTATPNSTYLSLTVTSSSLDFIQTLLDETPTNELTDFMSHPVYTDAQTTLVVHNQEGNPELTSYISGASEVPLVQAKVLTEIKKLLPTHIPNAIANYVRPRLNTYVLEAVKTNQINLFTQSSTSTDDLSDMDLKIKLMNKIHSNKSNETHTTHQQLYDTLYESITLDQDALDAQAAQSSFHKRPHDNQDQPNNRKRENKKKRRMDVGEPSSRSSRRNRSLVIHAQVNTPTIQPLDPENEYIRACRNPEWYTKSGSVGATKRKTTWFDLLLKSDIDKNENHILGPSTVAIAKKLKAIIQKDELTIADLKGAGLETLKYQYHNDVELEYHVSQLKATMLTESKWNNDEDDVSKPRSYYKQGIEDMIPDRWCKETHRYIFEALNGIHYWDGNKIYFFKAKMSTKTEGSVYSYLRIKSVVRVVVKKKWGYVFLTSIVVRRSDDIEYEFSYAYLHRPRLNDVEDMYLF